MIISFFVPGIPVATQYRQTRKGMIYKTLKGKNWERTVQNAAKVAMMEAGNLPPFMGPVFLNLSFWFPIPKSRRELRHGDYHLQDPDNTNLLKNTEDGLKRIMFLDDNQVQIRTVTKRWCGGQVIAEPGCSVNLRIEESEGPK